MIVKPQDIFNYLRSLGVSEASAAGILANIEAESTFDSGAEGDKNLSTSSWGLFQWRGVRYTNLVSYADSVGADWTDWKVQIDFALTEARGMGINLQATSAHDAAKEWSLVFERPAGGATTADARGHAADQYMLGGSAGSGDASPQAGNEVLNLPSGGKWFRVDGQYYVAFRFWGNDNKKGPSQVVYYKSSTPPPDGEVVHGADNWNRHVNNWVDGGSTDTFRGTPEGKSYQDLVNDLLFRLGLAGTNALKDPGIMAVIALAMTREMSEAELANRLRQTDWWNERTDLQREWNDLSDAEKELRIVDAAMNIVGLWFTYTGQDLEIAQYDTNGDGIVDAAELKAGNKDLFQWAKKIASGKSSQVQAVNQWIKEVALEDNNSPWSRTIREEEQAQGENSVAISNMVGSIKSLYNDWGIPITNKRAKDLAIDVIMNRMSFEAVEKDLRQQAQGIYPHKPEFMSTREWAEPYMQMYMQTLELSEVELDNPALSGALADGMSLTDFRKELRQDDRWLETNNARTEMNTTISGLGRVMGF